LQINAIELRIVALPLVTPFVAAHGTTATRTAVIVRVLGPEADGWGECAALPEPTYTEEYVDGAFAVLRDDLGPRLLAAGATSAADLRNLFTPVVGQPMARAALELALLDAECAIDGQPLAQKFSADARRSVPAGVAIGLLRSPDATAAEAASRVAEGYQRLKLKIEPGHDIDVLRAVRDAIGPDIALMVDANGSYGIDDADQLGRLDQFALTCIEQPLAAEAPGDPGGLAAHATLATRIATPICLDESLISIQRTKQALTTGACSVVCIKAPRYGSWLDAAAMLERCRELGIDAWVGGMLDTGIGRLANIALAAHPAATLTGDISATSRFFDEDICGPVEVTGPAGAGTIAVPTAFGFSAAINRESLDRLTIHAETLRN
jgi:O-succinylbenzoate synthase